MLTALTRGVSRCIGDCQLTFLSRRHINVPKAIQQHRAYEQCLEQMGVRIVSLPAEPELPDAVFVEDTAVVVDEVAVIATMGAVKRRPEVKSLASVLAGYRTLRYLNHSATLEGGDVVRVGRTLYVGVSGRTNRPGVSQLSEILRPFDYEVRPVEVKGCLHLSTGCSYLGRNSILVNRAWVDASQFEGREIIDVPASEPWAANAIVINEVVLLPSAYPATRLLLEERGFYVRTTDISELEKAEAGLTCMSLIFVSHEQKSGNGNGRTETAERRSSLVTV